MLPPNLIMSKNVMILMAAVSVVSGGGIGIGSDDDHDNTVNWRRFFLSLWLDVAKDAKEMYFVLYRLAFFWVVVDFFHFWTRSILFSFLYLLTRVYFALIDIFIYWRFFIFCLQYIYWLGGSGWCSPVFYIIR